MGNKKFKGFLCIATVFVIILLTGISSRVEISAKTSDFVINKDVLEQYNGSEKEVVIPKGIKTIGANAFRDSMIEKVTIPNGVNTIGESAFQNCSKLTQIVIPEGVTDMGAYAFRDCSSLVRVELCKGLYVNMCTFENCTNLKEVIMPEGVFTLGFYAFRNCSSLEMIDLPETISFIGGGCFENCTSLETILFPTQDPFIGSKAFYNTIWLDKYEGDNVIINHTLILYRGKEKNITIPKNIKVIAYGAYENCSFITKVNIPNGVKEIGISAFSGCTGLSEIVIPQSVTDISSYAFYGCSNLSKITIPEDVQIRRDSLEGTKWMTDYQDDFIILSGNLLGYQGSDSKVVIPNNVHTICTGAFFFNDFVTEVIVPKNVTKIYYGGFSSCRNLQKVYITGKNIYIDYQVFIECNNDFTLYGTKGGTVDEYAKNYSIPFVSQGLNITKTTLYLGGDDTTNLRLNGVEGTITWTSEDDTIATVSKNGKVTALKTGSTRIKAKAEGITFTCEITVKKPFISKSSVTIYIAQTARLNLIGVSSDITWSSSNKSVATVSSNGVITANKVGNVTITATVNGKKYTCKVTVKQ